MQTDKKDAVSDRSVNAPKPLKLLKRIGSTNYEVSVFFSNTSKETMEDKILRLIEREARNV